MKVIQVIVTL